MENSMQQVETKKSEKLVPIDTSGESVDIELKEENISPVQEEVSDDTPIVEIQEEETVPKKLKKKN